MTLPRNRLAINYGFRVAGRYQINTSCYVVDKEKPEKLCALHTETQVCACVSPCTMFRYLCEDKKFECCYTCGDQNARPLQV